MLRQKHAGHGLSLVVDGSINRRSSLSDMSTRLRAAPQFDRQGQRFGTFEVWRRGVREVPIPLQYRETHGAIGAGTSGVRTFAIGEDLAPIAPLSRGYTLQDALRSLPQLRQLLTQFGMHTGCARCLSSRSIRDDGIGGLENHRFRSQALLNSCPAGDSDSKRTSTDRRSGSAPECQLVAYSRVIRWRVLRRLPVRSSMIHMAT